MGLYNVLPDNGSRIKLANHIGTVRYIGPVTGTTGVWLGIEWDNSERGHHNGIKDGKRYFTCCQPRAGSFIRPTMTISYGKSFLEALNSKYIEDLRSHDSPENITLGASQGGIVVQAAGFDKIRKKLANLERLRDVSLNDEDVCKSDYEGLIQQTCPNIRSIDLSLSLIANWDVVASITRELPALQQMILNRNRLGPFTNSQLMQTAFHQLRELILNKTEMTWSEMHAVIAFMPKLETVEMGYNDLNCLGSHHLIHAPSNSSLKNLNLESNLLSDWFGVWKSLHRYESLQRLILTSNIIDTIPFPENPDQRLSLKFLSLSQNKIRNWSVIDALSTWCPLLENFSFIGNPLTFSEVPKYVRTFLICRIPSLAKLDGTLITNQERITCQNLYYSHVHQQRPSFLQEQFHTVNLCSKNEITFYENSAKKLSQQLIVINLHRDLIRTHETALPIVIKVLPAMTLKSLKVKVSKVIQCSKSTFRLWSSQINGELLELKSEHDSLELGQLGIQEGSNVVFNVISA